jgi:hypothetical protein
MSIGAKLTYRALVPMLMSISVTLGGPLGPLTAHTVNILKTIAENASLMLIQS